MGRFQCLFVTICVTLCVVEVQSRRRLGAGYRHAVATNDPTVLQLANWAARQLGGRLVTVQSAEEQVVAGLKWYINMEIQTQSDEQKVCRVIIWEQLWRNFRRILSGTRCGDERLNNGRP